MTEIRFTSPGSSLDLLGSTGTSEVAVPVTDGEGGFRWEVVQAEFPSGGDNGDNGDDDDVLTAVLWSSQEPDGDESESVIIKVDQDAFDGASLWDVADPLGPGTNPSGVVVPLDATVEDFDGGLYLAVGTYDLGDGDGEVRVSLHDGGGLIDQTQWAGQVVAMRTDRAFVTGGGSHVQLVGADEDDVPTVWLVRLADDGSGNPVIGEDVRSRSLDAMPSFAARPTVGVYHPDPSDEEEDPFGALFIGLEDGRVQVVEAAPDDGEPWASPQTLEPHGSDPGEAVSALVTFRPDGWESGDPEVVVSVLGGEAVAMTATDAAPVAWSASGAWTDLVAVGDPADPAGPHSHLVAAGQGDIWRIDTDDGSVLDEREHGWIDLPWLAVAGADEEHLLVTDGSRFAQPSWSDGPQTVYLLDGQAGSAFGDVLASRDAPSGRRWAAPPIAGLPTGTEE